MPERLLPVGDSHGIAVFDDELQANAHDLFQTWRRDNSRGFFINCKGKRNWMVHRATCPHPGDMDWTIADVPHSLTKRRKACSTDLRELVRWAAQNGTGDLISCSDCSPLPLAVEQIRLPEEVDSTALIREGAKHPITVNAYERDPAARRLCIAAHGTNCSICGFSFGARYGEAAEGLIHVHHLRPLSEVGEEYMVDPVVDLRPVCPNCHAVLHRREPAYSLDEVRQFLEARKNPPL